MHELSIAQAILDQVQEAARKEKADRVTGIALAIGALSGVDHGSLEFVFPLAAEGTTAADATLTVEITAGRELCIKSIELET